MGDTISESTAKMTTLHFVQKLDQPAWRSDPLTPLPQPHHRVARSHAARAAGSLASSPWLGLRVATVTAHMGEFRSECTVVISARNTHGIGG